MIHHVFANRSNVGDWLAARGIQHLLQPLAIREHLCDQPFAATTLAELRALDRDDLVVIGGGGLFMEYFLPFWREFDMLTDQRDLRFVLWGVGFCDLKQEPSCTGLGIFRSVVGKSRLCRLRDPLSNQLLGLDPPPIGCPCVSALPLRSEPGWGILHVDNYSTVGSQAFEVMDRQAAAFASSTGRPYYRTNNRIEPNRVPELERVIEAYRSADIIYSSALHGCLLGAVMGRKVVAVSGDRKIESMMEYLGLSEWVLNFSEVANGTTLLHRCHQQPGVQASLERILAQQQETAAAVRNLVAK